MLQLQVKRASVQLDQEKLLYEPETDERVASYVPTASSALRLHAALDLDAQYLNMNINELEPLVEPWEASVHLATPVFDGASEPWRFDLGSGPGCASARWRAMP